jgi:DNA-binding beta-propeller fold protein YncE
MILATLLLLLLDPQPASALPGEAALPDIGLNNVITSYGDKQPFGNPAGIFYEPLKSEIYLADAGNHQIGIFDIKGATLWTFKHWVTDSRTGERSLGAPHSIVVNREGDIIVSDNKADYLDVFDYRGDFLQRIEPRDYDNVGSLRAAVLALDSEGNLYIGTRTDRLEILKLSDEFEMILRFGERGEGAGQFDNISGIWVASDGRVMVSDVLSEPVIKIFSSNGEYLGGFGGHTESKGDFSYPAGLAMTKGGRIWIVDSLRQVVKCVSPDGDFVTMIGGLGFRPGDMNYPSAVASDGDTLLFVAERIGNRFQQFVIK